MSKAKHISTGEKGEKIAADFLQNLGFDILNRNWRHGKAEIDLIVKKDNLLVAVEVKTRSTSAFGEPSEAVGEKKWERLANAIEVFAVGIGFAGEIRIDVVSITFDENIPSVVHHPDVFFDEGNLD